MEQELSTGELAHDRNLSFSDLDFLNAKPEGGINCWHHLRLMMFLQSGGWIGWEDHCPT
jgi:hypothetical protein